MTTFCDKKQYPQHSMQHLTARTNAFRSRGARWFVLGTLVLSPVLGLGCGSSNPHRESLSEHYWEVQSLRQQAGSSVQGAEALRDLGVVYLRTGYYQDAYNVLSRSLVQDRSDPKRWLYSGLSLELLDRPDAALSAYERFLSLTSASLHTRAMRGRVAWLRGAIDRHEFERLFARTTVPGTDSLSPNLYAVFPLDCSASSPDFHNVGLGMSEIISRDFEQLRNVETVDAGTVRMAYSIAGDADNMSNLSRPAWTGRMLGAGKIVGGTCQVSENERIDIDLVLQDLITEEVYLVSGSDQLRNANALQKQLVQDVAEQLRIWVPDRQGADLNTFPGREALVTFSDGLAAVDAGALLEGRELFQRSLDAAPSFSLAELLLGRIDNMVLARVEQKKDVIDLVVFLESSDGTNQLLDSGANALSLSLGAGFVPGRDSRRQPPSNVGELPTPPTAPKSGGN